MASVEVTTNAKPGRRAGPSRRLVAIGVVVSIVAVLAISSVSAYVVLNWPDARVQTRDLLGRMAARDSSAGDFLDKSASLRTLADKMGIVDVPGSVHLSIEGLQVTTPTPPPGASKLSKTDSLVSATYTLKWSGNATSGSVRQTLTAVARNGPDGRIRLYQIAVSPALVFDDVAYFGTAGTSEADAKRVADDLRAGVSWLPGMSVYLASTEEAVVAPPSYTVVPGHLTTWTSVVSPAVDGSRTIWNVQIDGGDTPYTAISPASVVTQEPVAAKVDTGDMQPGQADAGAIATAKAFWSAVDSRSLAKANAFIVAGPKLDAAALGVMIGWGASNGGLGGSAPAGLVTESASGIQDQIGNDVYVLSPTGKWGLDASRSKLILNVATGKRGSYTLVVNNGQTGTAACSTKISIQLARVTFYTDGLAPEALFSISSSAKCDVGDQIVTATSGWRGNSGGTALTVNQPASSPGAAIYRAITLPAKLKPGMTPIWVKITRYGSPAIGAYLPYTMQFSTY